MHVNYLSIIDTLESYSVTDGIITLYKFEKIGCTLFY